MTTSAEPATAFDNRRVRASDFQVIVRQLYRLYRVSSLHLDNNEALTRTLAQSLSVFSSMQHLGLDYVSVLFLDDTVFVNGRLLKASAEVYGYAWQIAAFLKKPGYNELSIHCDATENDIRAFLRLLATTAQIRDHSSGSEPVWQAGGLRLRRLAPRSLHFLKTDQLSPAERISRSYVSMLLVARDALQHLKTNEAVNLRPLRRAVQSLVRESAINPVWFQYMARGRSLHDDPAGMVTKQTVLAICMLRPLTSDEAAINRVALACVHHWLANLWTVSVHKGRTSAGESTSTASAWNWWTDSLHAGLTSAPPPVLAPGISGPQVALASEAVLFGLLTSPISTGTLEQLVVAYEAHLLATSPELCPIPVTPSLVDLEPWIIVVAERCARAMTFDVRSQSHLSPDAAIELLVRESRNRVEVLLSRLLSVGLLLETPAATFEQSTAWWIDPPFTEADVPNLRFSGANAATNYANTPSAVRRIDTPIEQVRRPASVPFHSGAHNLDSNFPLSRPPTPSPIQSSPTPAYPFARETPFDLHPVAQASFPPTTGPQTATSLPPSNLDSRSTEDSARVTVPALPTERTLPTRQQPEQPASQHSRTVRVNADFPGPLAPIADNAGTTVRVSTEAAALMGSTADQHGQTVRVTAELAGVTHGPTLARLAQLAQQAQQAQRAQQTEDSSTAGSARPTSASPLHSPSSSPTVAIPSRDELPQLADNEPTRFLSSSSSPTVSLSNIDDWLGSHKVRPDQAEEVPAVEHNGKPDKLEPSHEQHPQRDATSTAARSAGKRKDGT
jgi:hypothetical protein